MNRIQMWVDKLHEDYNLHVISYAKHHFVPRDKRHKYPESDITITYTAYGHMQTAHFTDVDNAVDFLEQLYNTQSRHLYF